MALMRHEEQKEIGMIYESYLDDGLDAQQARMAVSAGFCGTKEAWIQLSQRWTHRLKNDGLEYFKTSEYKMLRKQFEIF